MTQAATLREGLLRSVDEHLAEILGGIAPLDEFALPLLEAQGCVLAEDAVIGHPLPSYDCAAVDGYAVRSADVAAAAAAHPVRLQVLDDIALGEIATGAWQSRYVPEGAAMRTVTGAPIPAGADAVVPVDATDAGVAAVHVPVAVRPGSHVRRQGEDMRAGDRVAGRGTTIGPAAVALLAAAGRDRVLVRPTPRVVVVSVGDELVEPGSAPRAGVSVDINSYALAAAVRQAGGVAYRLGTVPDDADRLRSLLDDNLIRGDLVVTTGGIGGGERDVVRSAVGRLGDVGFYRVAVDPGPLHGFGRVGPDETPVCCLPGDPVAALTGFELFVRPALHRLAGRTPPVRPRRPAVLAAPVESRRGARGYRYGVVETRGADVVVRPHPVHLSAELADANAFIVLPEDAGRLEAGATVDVELLGAAAGAAVELRTP